MRTRLLISIALAALLALPSTATAAPRGQNFGTHLTGAEEVPPRATFAQGDATFSVNTDETIIEFRLIVSNIENVTAAHIHCAPPGVNGGIVEGLYGDAPPGGGRHDGVLATGSFPTAGETCQGMPLVDAMRAGLTYVNVHTNDGVGDTNTGPGDFPGGEIRGQIEPRGPSS
jgi:hypothetical protein